MTSKETAGLASALGSTTRLTILQHLAQSGRQGLIVGDIQRRLNIPGSTLSHHLDRLREAGFVSIHRQGTFLWYLPVFDRVLELANSLVDLLGAPGMTVRQEATAYPPAHQEVEIETD